MLKINFYAQKNGKWTKRKKTLKDPLFSELYDAAKELNLKYNLSHWGIPAGNDPKQLPLLLEMEKVALGHLKSYHNDFYLLDMHDYLNGDRKGIWILRDSGSHYLPLKERFDRESINVYISYINANRYFYLIEEDKMKKITRDRAIKIVKELAAVAV